MVRILGPLHSNRSTPGNIGNNLVVCPIVRDNTGNLNGVESVDVQVVSNGAIYLACVLQSYSALGDLVAFDSVRMANQNIYVLPLKIDISIQGGSYSIACDLPPEGRILGYRVTEY